MRLETLRRDIIRTTRRIAPTRISTLRSSSTSRACFERHSTSPFETISLYQRLALIIHSGNTTEQSGSHTARLRHQVTLIPGAETMRLHNWCATALATGALFCAKGARADDGGYTTTIYVERAHPTQDGPSSIPPGVLLYSTSAGGKGASPTAAPTGLLTQGTNAAAAVGVEKVGMAALAGLVGLVVY